MSATREGLPNDPITEDRLQKAALEAIVRGEEPGDLLEVLQAHVGEERARAILDRAYTEYEALQQTGRLGELERASLRKKSSHLGMGLQWRTDAPVRAAHLPECTTGWELPESGCLSHRRFGSSCHGRNADTVRLVPSRRGPPRLTQADVRKSGTCGSAASRPAGCRGRHACSSPAPSSSRWSGRGPHARAGQFQHQPRDRHVPDAGVAPLPDARDRNARGARAGEVDAAQQAQPAERQQLALELRERLVGVRNLRNDRPVRLSIRRCGSRTA